MVLREGHEVLEVHLLAIIFRSQGWEVMLDTTRPDAQMPEAAGPGTRAPGQAVLVFRSVVAGRA